MNHEIKIDKEKWVKSGEMQNVYVEGLPDDYSVKVQYYQYQDKEHLYWNQAEIIVFKNNEPYMTLGRNYSSVPESAYAKQGNKEFIITSGDYMCITVINLTDKTIESYTDEARYKFGSAFCPVEIHYDEDYNEVTVHGCVWACPYEIITFDNIDLCNPVFDWDNASRCYDDDYEYYCDEDEDDDSEN